MISTVTYNGDGATRIFPVAFEIKGEEYTVVYVGGVAVADRSLYDIINNSIVFNTAPVIGTNNVEIVVASTTTEIADLNAPPSTIQTVLDNMVDINAIANTVIPNIDEILLADDNASIATAKALEAATSAGEALASKNLAVTSAGSALVSEQNADASEALALSYKNSAEASATTATTQAGIATTKAGEASTSASQALVCRNEAEAFADTLDPSKIVAKDSSTGSAMMPAGTTAERTALPSNGNLRYNEDLSKFEGYQGGVWSTLGGLEINTLTAKVTPIDADEMVLADSISSFSLKKLTWSNLKATILAYMQTTTMSKIIQGTAVASTSGTSIDFTGIPSWVKKVTVMFNGVSTNGTSQVQVQLGDSEGIEVIGYVSTSSTAGGTTLSSTSALLVGGALASEVRNGQLHISHMGGNTFVSNSIVSVSTGQLYHAGGSKTLSATLDRIRITTVNGTDTFDAGQINIMYEG